MSHEPNCKGHLVSVNSETFGCSECDHRISKIDLAKLMEVPKRGPCGDLAPTPEPPCCLRNDASGYPTSCEHFRQATGRILAANGDKLQHVRSFLREMARQLRRD